MLNIARGFLALIVVMALWVPTVLGEFLEQPASDSQLRLTAATMSGVPSKSRLSIEANGGSETRCDAAAWQGDTFHAEGTFCLTDEHGGWQLSDDHLKSYAYLKNVRSFAPGMTLETVLGEVQILRFNVVGMPTDEFQCAAFIQGFDRGIGASSQSFRKAFDFYVCTSQPWSMTEGSSSFVGGISDDQLIDILGSLSIEGEFDSLF